MTRINSGVQPKELHRKHLLAEIRELPRILNTVKSGKAKIKADQKELKFKLGQHHVRFYYDKLGYLVKRHKSLVKEAKSRGYNIMDYESSYNDLPQHLNNDWEETAEARKLIQERIEERLKTMQL